ncbi:hypothetical protein E2320_000602, partial [Naja naja]
TQGANQQGDITSAKKYSRVAFILDNTAVGLGIAMIIGYFSQLVGGNKSSQCGKDLAGQ